MKPPSFLLYFKKKSKPPPIMEKNCGSSKPLIMTRKTIAFSRCAKMVQITLDLLAFY
jgi:hypothetical protein